MLPSGEFLTNYVAFLWVEVGQPYCNTLFLMLYTGVLISS